jgi:hypothetical protein
MSSCLFGVAPLANTAIFLYVRGCKSREI